MKHSAITLVIIFTTGLTSCTYRGTASERTNWDSGAQKEEAILQEKRDDRDQRLNNQLPRQRPITNQRPF